MLFCITRMNDQRQVQGFGYCYDLFEDLCLAFSAGSIFAVVVIQACFSYPHCLTGVALDLIQEQLDFRIALPVN
jgi:hypothetical protein